MAQTIPFYKLPLELIEMVFEYLSFDDILNICEDPEFPVAAIRRKHIVHDREGSTILHAISEQGWNHVPSTIRRFIDLLGTSWQSVGYVNQTPLGIAAAKNRVELCRLFIEAGAWINNVSGKEKGIPPLFCAVGSPGNDDVISLLIDHGADIFWKGPSDIGIIHLAAEHANVHSMELLLNAGADPNDRCAIDAPLHNVNDPAVATILIERGADVDGPLEVNKDARRSPLIPALKRRNLEVVKILLAAGADTNVFSEDGLTPLYIAIQNSRGETSTVKMVIDAGCDVNLRETERGLTPVLLAAYHEFEDIVRILIEVGADVVEAKDNKRQNGLFTVAATSSPSILKMFIDGGADVNALNFDLQTPLFSAIKALRPENVKMLLDANADPSHQDEEGTEPAILVVVDSCDALDSIYSYFSDMRIKWISQSDYFIHEDDENLDEDTSMLRHLIDHGADISQTQFNGIGILHFAAWRNDKEIIKLLLDGGADPLFTDPDGNTATDWAAEMTRTQEGNVEIEEMLRAAEKAATEAK